MNRFVIALVTVGLLLPEVGADEFLTPPLNVIVSPEPAARRNSEPPVDLKTESGPAKTPPEVKAASKQASSEPQAAVKAGPALRKTPAPTKLGQTLAEISGALRKPFQKRPVGPASKRAEGAPPPRPSVAAISSNRSDGVTAKLAAIFRTQHRPEVKPDASVTRSGTAIPARAPNKPSEAPPSRLATMFTPKQGPVVKPTGVTPASAVIKKPAGPGFTLAGIFGTGQVPKKPTPVVAAGPATPATKPTGQANVAPTRPVRAAASPRPSTFVRTPPLPARTPPALAQSVLPRLALATPAPLAKMPSNSEPPLAAGRITAGPPEPAEVPVLTAPLYPLAPAPSPAIDGHGGYSVSRRMQFCRTPLGQLARSIVMPIHLGTGGLVPQCCSDVPTPAELARMTPENTSLPEAAAAKIKADEAGARARRAAVRYLGTVDCHYFLEAEEALVAALRCDRNECVRLEAALALGNGNCCSTRTVQALQIVAAGECTDHNPAETSERVKSAALAGLQRCLAHQPLPPPLEPVAPPPRPYLPDGPAAATGHKLQQIRHVPPSPAARQETAEAIAAAWRTLAEKVSADPTPAQPPTGQRNLLDILVNAGTTGGPEKAAAEAATLPSLTPPAPPSAPATDLRSLGLTPIGRIPSPQP